MRLLLIHDDSLDSAKANVIQVLHMCRAFAGEGGDVELAVPSNGRSLSEVRSLAEEITGAEADFQISLFEKRTFGGRFTTIGAYLGAKQVIQTRQADYCWLRNPLAVPVAMKAGMHVLYEAHNSILHANRFVSAMRSRRLVRNASSIIVITPIRHK